MWGRQDEPTSCAMFPIKDEKDDDDIDDYVDNDDDYVDNDDDYDDESLMIMMIKSKTWWG